METLGVFVFEFALAIIFAAVFLGTRSACPSSPTSSSTASAASVGVRLLAKAVDTTRSTVRGVVGSALAEALVATLFYFVAGVPAWLLLGGLTFLAALVQIGAPLVWIPGCHLAPCQRRDSAGRSRW